MAASVTFRVMKTADLQKVSQIERDSNVRPWTQEKLESCLNNKHYRSWLCCVNDEIVAYALTHTVLDESTLINFLVSKDKQGEGYGKALLNHVLAHAKECKVQSYNLEVRASNLRAINLYESCEFKQIAIRKNYYPSLLNKNPDREDAIIYSWSAPTIE